MSTAPNIEEDIGKVASKVIEKEGEDGNNGLADNVQEQDEHHIEEHDEDDGVDDEMNDGDAISEYIFASEEEMDPLTVTEEVAIANPTYLQFELPENEYEALAAKKRKALAAQDSQREGLVRKLGLDDITGVSIEELMDELKYGRRRKSRKIKKRGRRMGSKNKVSTEVTRKIGDANLHYAHNRFEEAIRVLYEIVRIATHLPDPYHTLGLVYYAMGDKNKALDFYLLAANLSPKDAFRWELAAPLCIELGNYAQARNCLRKAIRANPEDISLMFSLASLYDNLQDYEKAAESYEQVLRKFPNNFEALEKATMLYKRCGQQERSAAILEDYLRSNPSEADLGKIDSLAGIYVKNGEHTKALQHIEYAKNVYFGGKELPPDLAVKEGICYAHLGDTEKAEIIFSSMTWKNVNDPELLGEVANLLLTLGHYDSALKYFLVLEENEHYNSGFLHKNIAHCYLNVKEKGKAIEYLYKALYVLEDNVDVRLDLATLLLEEDKEEDAILVLSPPESEFKAAITSYESKQPWWLDERIKLKLCHIYRTKGWTRSFVETIFSSVRDSLFLETVQQKFKGKKKLSKSELSKRVQVLDDHQTDSLFHGRPLASTVDRSKATRAKKVLQKRAALKEETKAAALAAGLDWNSDDSDDDYEPQQPQVHPLPNLLKDEENHQLIVDLCKALVDLQKYSEAMEVINLTLKLASNSLSTDKQEQLRSLGAQIPYNIADTTHCWDYVHDIVVENPQSFAAWNSYYKVVSRLEGRNMKHNRFLHNMRIKQKDNIPPIMITGHQLNAGSYHQDAAREYLQAYKLMPDSPLINLCVGSTIIDLAFGHRLHNKHQCVLQGLAFLYNNLRLCENSQESLYNLARAYHHVGLVTLAATYYEKVLAIYVQDYPIPKLTNGKTPDLDSSDNSPKKNRQGYCDLRREAAYNLHLIYKNSGAINLARQILKDHCTM